MVGNPLTPFKQKCRLHRELETETESEIQPESQRERQRESERAIESQRFSLAYIPQLLVV